ncbi:MAG: ABC transporter permease [Chthoniobacterales bacterium]|nr:ABC transporter permease [Chthoniobacterales bacterium]
MITDFKYAFRMLLKSPGFTIVAVLTLALGIGVNSAIFSVIDTVLLRPLSFPKPDQLVMIWGTDVNQPDSQETDSYPDFYDYRAQSQSFSGMAAFTGAGTVLNGFGEAQELRGVAVSGDFFEVMGVQPAFGRGFTAKEAKLGQPNVVVIGYGLWQRAFGKDPKIIGQQINLSGRSATLLGVMPPGWKFPVEAETSEFISPLEPLVASQVPDRGSHFLRLIGRLKPGVIAQQATAEMKPIAARLAAQYPDTNTGRDVLVRPLLDDIVGDVRPALFVLLGAVALVLLIACANVANLLLARAAARSREIGIRTALGASRLRIVRQLLAESFLLALLGGTGGLLLAWWGVDLLSAFGPRNVPRLNEVHIDLAICAFTFGLAVLSTIIFGLIPALQVARASVNESLQQGAKGSTGGLHGTRVRAFLVVSQVSLSLLLLTGAGLLIKSFFNLRATDPGFEPTRLLVLDQSIPRTKYPEPEAQRRFYQQLLPKLAALPGVVAVGGANPLPFSGNDNASSFRLASQPERGPGTHPDASNLVVVPGYFRSMKIPLRAGRVFDEHDNETGRQVAIVNEAFVRRFLSSTNPIGERILRDKEGGADALEIIGVVGNAKQTDLKAEVAPEFYQPFAQAPGRRLWLTFRTETENLAGLGSAIRKVIREQDPDVFVGNLDAMTFLLGENLAQPKFNMMLLAIFAGVALILAAIGIYGVIAYSVAQRTREIGIRMALGAQRADMLTMILRQSLSVVAIGLTIGLVAALAATRLLASLLYGVGANDLLTYVAVIFLLGGAALLASYIPARRAMKVDPMVALRYE